jgi:hypothetical protein
MISSSDGPWIFPLSLGLELQVDRQPWITIEM